GTTGVGRSTVGNAGACLGPVADWPYLETEKGVLCLDGREGAQAKVGPVCDWSPRCARPARVDRPWGNADAWLGPVAAGPVGTGAGVGGIEDGGEGAEPKVGPDCDWSLRADDRWGESQTGETGKRRRGH